MSDPYFKPYIGQRVKFNSRAYVDCKLQSAEAFEQSKDLTITGFEDINDGYGSPPIWVVEVDKPLINQFLLDTSMLTPLDGLSGHAKVLTF